MLPKQAQIDQIERLHKAIDVVDKKIDLVKENPEQKLNLLRQYRHLNQAWQKIDNVLESVKFYLDSISGEHDEI